MSTPEGLERLLRRKGCGPNEIQISRRIARRRSHLLSRPSESEMVGPTPVSPSRNTCGMRETWEQPGDPPLPAQDNLYRSGIRCPIEDVIGLDHVLKVKMMRGKSSGINLARGDEAKQGRC